MLINRIGLALVSLCALAVPALADESPNQAKQRLPLVWVSATEVWVRTESPVVDTVWETIDVAPVMTKSHVPEYPKEAKKLGLEAEVWVKALVATDGTVHCAKITEVSAHGLEPGFELSALHAALKNTFRPAQKAGRHAATWVAYPVRFRLS